MRNSCSFVFYESVWKQYQILDARRPEAAKAFTRAVVEYGLYDIVPPEDDEVWMYGLEQTITSIDAAKGRREKNQEDGSKGGRPAIRFERQRDTKRAEQHGLHLRKGSYPFFVSLPKMEQEKIYEVVITKEYSNIIAS